MAANAQTHTHKIHCYTPLSDSVFRPSSHLFVCAHVPGNSVDEDFGTFTLTFDGTWYGGSPAPWYPFQSLGLDWASPDWTCEFTMYGPKSSRGAGAIIKLALGIDSPIVLTSPDPSIGASLTLYAPTQFECPLAHSDCLISNGPVFGITFDYVIGALTETKFDPYFSSNVCPKLDDLTHCFDVHVQRGSGYLGDDDFWVPDTAMELKGQYKGIDIRPLTAAQAISFPNPVTLVASEAHPINYTLRFDATLPTDMGKPTVGVSFTAAGEALVDLSGIGVTLSNNYVKVLTRGVLKSGPPTFMGVVGPMPSLSFGGYVESPAGAHVIMFGSSDASPATWPELTNGRCNHSLNQHLAMHHPSHHPNLTFDPKPHPNVHHNHHPALSPTPTPAVPTFALYLPFLFP